MQKEVVQVLNPFLFFMFSFQKTETHSMLCMMFNLHYKGLGLIIQFASKDRTLQIANEYDR
jgi:hypothetical protein